MRKKKFMNLNKHSKILHLNIGYFTDVLHFIFYTLTAKPFFGAIVILKRVNCPLHSAVKV